MKKRVLYLGLQFHLRTKSNVFLLDMLREVYDIEQYYYDLDGQPVFNIDEVTQKSYDFLICWQVMLPKTELNKFHYGKRILFPMYDQVAWMPDEEWKAYYDFTIISFSKTLYNKLVGQGFQAYYIQYFPEPLEVKNWGDEHSLFFWQRISSIHSSLLMKVCDNLGLRSLHVHKSLDPGHFYTRLNDNYECEVTVTKWLENKKDLVTLIQQSAYYAAPRLYEGIGMSFLEAMAQGRCVIAPDHSTMNEYIMNGKTGILYDYSVLEAVSKPKVREIQKNTYDYMCEGFSKWKEQRYSILDWIEEKPVHLAVLKEDEDSQTELEGNVFTQEQKLRYYYGVLNRWMRLSHQGLTPVKFLECAEMKQIAIYGCGELANRLIEEVGHSEIEIAYLIDRKKKGACYGLPIYSLEEQLKPVDAVIITPGYIFDKIVKDLQNKMQCPMITWHIMFDYLEKWGKT